jgi:hypothetical protein
MHRSVRLFASRALTRRIGFRATVEFILKRYPGTTLSRTPLEYFLQQGHFYTIPAKRAHGIGDQILATSPYIRERYGKPVFFHRGFPVVSEESQKDNAQYRHGVIAMGLGKKGVPEQYRRVVAEHEYGEIWGHEMGLAFELLYLKKKGLLEEFLKEYPAHALQIWEKVVRKNKDFADFAPFFAKIAERYPGGVRQYYKEMDERDWARTLRRIEKQRQK